MQAACGDFLAMIGMQATVEAAVATCPPPPPPCTSFAEFGVYSHAVTEACCSDDAPCANGVPSTCSQACEDVLLPMQRACAEFEIVMPDVQDAMDAAAAMCANTHGGH
jgi:hypothetical protein